MRRLFALAVVGFLLSACGGGGGSSSTLIPAQSGPAAGAFNRHSNDLPEPPNVKAVNGVATVELTAQINPATGLPTFDYNGEIGVVPTIRVKPGDEIVIDVLNSLPEGQKMQGDLNLHFHGLEVSPNPPADDVLTTLALPGGTLHYVVPIPKNSDPGLYWYHPHVHGQTNYQVGEAGMSGAIVVEGLSKHLPGLAKMTERLMIVRDTGIGPTIKVHGHKGSSCAPEPTLTVSLNGAVTPDIPIEPGESQFFRLINATGHKNLKLAVDGGTMEVVAIDGVALDKYPGTGPTETVSTLVVPPAARAEFVVTGPASGKAKFRTICYDSGPAGDPDPPSILANLVSKEQGSSRIARRTSPRLTVGAPLPQNEMSFPLPPVAAQRTAIFSEDANGFYINGKAFEMHSKPMFVVHVGTVEEWHIVNVSREVHDFHIHQVHFYIEDNDGVKVAHPIWADSVVIPRARVGASGNLVPGTLTLLMDFRNPIIRGEFVFHCHILDHEDAGMMAKIEAI